MRISDWSSDVCSSDLPAQAQAIHGRIAVAQQPVARVASSQALEAAGTGGAGDQGQYLADHAGHARVLGLGHGHRHAAALGQVIAVKRPQRSEEHTSELQSLMRISYAVFCLQTKKKPETTNHLSNKR